MFEINSAQDTVHYRREDGSREKYDPNKPKVDKIWPVTIVKARYGGGYEGGKWLAFNVTYDDVPLQVNGDDITCAGFFNDYNYSNKRKSHLKIGRGETPDEALKDLVAQYYG